MMNTIHSDNPTMSASDSNLATNLMSLPVELLHLIVGYIITGYTWNRNRNYHTTWYDEIEGFNDSNRRFERKRALAFSSCSKDLRKVIFRDLVISQVVVRFNEKDLSELASMSIDLRRCIK